MPVMVLAAFKNEWTEPDSTITYDSFLTNHTRWGENYSLKYLLNYFIFFLCLSNIKDESFLTCFGNLKRFFMMLLLSQGHQGWRVRLKNRSLHLCPGLLSKNITMNKNYQQLSVSPSRGITVFWFDRDRSIFFFFDIDRYFSPQK